MLMENKGFLIVFFLHIYKLYIQFCKKKIIKTKKIFLNVYHLQRNVILALSVNFKYVSLIISF